MDIDHGITPTEQQVMRKPTIYLAAIFAATGITGLLSAGPSVAADLSDTTKKNLETAMHGEAFANLKYQAYAMKAAADGHPELAKLFTESANIEANEHFAREADALGLVGTNSANLLDAITGEHYENTQMYVAFAEQAEKAGDTKVASMFRQIAADEGDHYQAYKAALDKLKTTTN